jgi:hypothetical protein
VDNDQRGDAQAEHELQRLHRFPAKFPALVERPDPEAGMDQGRGVKRDRYGGKSPEQGVVVHARGKRIQRNIAERVVEEMADQIGKQHQPAGQPQLPNADAAEVFRQPLPRKSGHAIQSNTDRVDQR